MTIQQETIAKISKLPEPLVKEVNDFVDFLLMKKDSGQWKLWMQFTESTEIAESEFSEYLSNLENYEERLARGEIQW